MILIEFITVACLLFLNKRVIFGILTALSCIGVLSMLAFVHGSETIDFTVSLPEGEQTYYAVRRTPVLSIELDHLAIYEPVAGKVIGKKVCSDYISRSPEPLSERISVETDGNKVIVFKDGKILSGYDSDEYTFTAE